MASILLVEDSKMIVATITLLLEKVGHQIVTAYNGNEGVKAAQSDNFDLLLTDIVMPEKDGIQTIIEVRRDKPDLRIIAMSGGSLAGMEQLDHAMKIGANAIMPKPFTADQLFAVVSEQLSQRAAA